MTVTGWITTRVCRVTSSGAVIPELDGIRSLALLAILMHHIMASYLVQSETFGKVALPRDWDLVAGRHWLIGFTLHLSFAVRVFFTLSGFILALPFARRCRAGLPAPDLRSFYLRRVVRMEPTYVLSCVVCFLVIVLYFGHKEPGAYFGAFFSHFAASLFYLHDLVFGYASWVNGITWTLEVDMQFYLIVPLLATIFRIRSAGTRKLVLIAMALGFSLVSQFLIEPSGNGRLQLSLVNYTQFFVVGYLLADIVTERGRAVPVKSFRSDATFLVSLVLLGVLVSRFPRLGWYVPFCLVPLFWGVLEGRITSRFFRSPLLAIPGAMCYTIYLYHELVIRMLLPYTLPLSRGAFPLWAAFAVQTAILVPAVLVFSVPLFLLAEKPFMRLSRDLSLRREARVKKMAAAHR